VEGLDVNTSIEVSFGRLKTHAHGSGLDRVEMEIQRLPLLLWFTLDSDNRLSPFARIAIGTCQTDFREEYGNSLYPSIRFHVWTFAWGYGTGLRYRCSDKLDLIAFTENWITESKILTQNFWNQQRGISAPYGDNPVGLRIVFRP
jgi:hypothetical protein